MNGLGNMRLHLCEYPVEVQSAVLEAFRSLGPHLRAIERDIVTTSISKIADWSNFINHSSITSPPEITRWAIQDAFRKKRQAELQQQKQKNMQPFFVTDRDTGFYHLRETDEDFISFLNSEAYLKKQTAVKSSIKRLSEVKLPVVPSATKSMDQATPSAAVAKVGTSSVNITVPSSSARKQHPTPNSNTVSVPVVDFDSVISALNARIAVNFRFSGEPFTAEETALMENITAVLNAPNTTLYQVVSILTSLVKLELTWLQLLSNTQQAVIRFLKSQHYDELNAKHSAGGDLPEILRLLGEMRFSLLMPVTTEAQAAVIREHHKVVLEQIAQVARYVSGGRQVSEMIFFV